MSKGVWMMFVTEKNALPKVITIWNFQFIHIRSNIHELEDNEETPLMYANHQWVSLVKEGDPNDLFDGPGGPRQKEETLEEPKIKWKNSMGRKILYEDIKAGTLKFDENNQPLMPLEDIYSMHAEYADYRFDRFAQRLEGIRGIVMKMESRADDDYYLLSFQGSDFLHCSPNLLPCPVCT
jgi:hypothetical protein